MKSKQARKSDIRHFFNVNINWWPTGPYKRDPYGSYGGSHAGRLWQLQLHFSRPGSQHLPPSKHQHQPPPPWHWPWSRHQPPPPWHWPWSRHQPPPPDTSLGPNTSHFPPDTGLGPDTSRLPPDTDTPAALLLYPVIDTLAGGCNKWFSEELMQTAKSVDAVLKWDADGAAGPMK